MPIILPPHLAPPGWDVTLNQALTDIIALVGTSSATAQSTAISASADTTTFQVSAEAAARVAADLLKVDKTSVGAANGVAPLDAGAKVPTAYLPPLSSGARFFPASQAAMLALSTAVVGDHAIRTDLSQEFVLQALPPSTLGNWIGLSGGGVNSVNGYTGTVSLAASDVGAPPTARTVAAGTGLTGGGDLSANRTLAVAYGTTAGTATQGNDSRVVGALQSGTAATGDLSGTYPSPVIAAGAVTNAKHSTMPGGTIKGNNTGSPATPVDLTVAQMAALLGGTSGTTLALGNDSRFGGAGPATAITVDTTGGLTGPNAQTALQNLKDTISGVSRAAGAVIVASSEAPATVKAGADYVCDGTADEVEINNAIIKASVLAAHDGAAIGGAQQYGHVLLTGGRFNVAASILMRSGVWLSGSGNLTELRAVSLTSSTGIGANPAIIKLATNTTHLVRVSDLVLEGNGSGGGGCHGIYWDMTGGTDTSAYPLHVDPDSYNKVSNLFIGGFTTGTRHGIWMYAASTANNRANHIDTVFMRNCSGDGIRYESASDSFISNCHIGGSGANGYYVGGGNTKISNCKSFYSNSKGMWLVSSRYLVSNFESQDDLTGVHFDGSPGIANGVVADTSSAAGIVVSTNDLVLTGFSIFCRASGRYNPMVKGLWYDATYTGLVLLGHIDSARTTTPTSGAPGSNSTVNVITS